MTAISYAINDMWFTINEKCTNSISYQCFDYMRISRRNVSSSCNYSKEIVWITYNDSNNLKSRNRRCNKTIKSLEESNLLIKEISAKI